jgi:hypothetical protein
MTNEEFKDLYEEALIHGWVTSKDPTVIARQKQKQKEYNAMYYYKRKNQSVVGPVNDPTHDPMMDASKALYDSKMKRYNKRQEKLKRRKRKKVSSSDSKKKLEEDIRKSKERANKTLEAVKDTVDKGKQIVERLSINREKVKSIKKRTDQIAAKLITARVNADIKVIKGVSEVGKRVVNKILSR